MSNSTGAERSRRYRAHKRGDHSFCPPGRADCAAVTPSQATVTRHAVTPAAADGPELGTRGRWLWQQVTGEGGELKPGERVLLEEACRAADRLDQLDRILQGTAGDWLRFHSANEDGTVVKVIVTGALVEVRQQQTTLARLLADLRTSRGAGAGRPPARGRPVTQTSKGGGGGGVADLAARIAARRGGATG